MFRQVKSMIFFFFKHQNLLSLYNYVKTDDAFNVVIFFL
jgi:hypothetical protein